MKVTLGVIDKIKDDLNDRLNSIFKVIHNSVGYKDAPDSDVRFISNYDLNLAIGDMEVILRQLKKMK